MTTKGLTEKYFVGLQNTNKLCKNSTVTPRIDKNKFLLLFCHTCGYFQVRDTYKYPFRDIIYILS